MAGLWGTQGWFLPRDMGVRGPYLVFWFFHMMQSPLPLAKCSGNVLHDDWGFGHVLHLLQGKFNWSSLSLLQPGTSDRKEPMETCLNGNNPPQQTPPCDFILSDLLLEHFEPPKLPGSHWHLQGLRKVLWNGVKSNTSHSPTYLPSTFIWPLDKRAGPLTFAELKFSCLKSALSPDLTIKGTYWYIYDEDTESRDKFGRFCWDGESGSGVVVRARLQRGSLSLADREP